MNSINRKLLSASDLGSLSNEQLIRLKNQMDVKVARGLAGNNQRKLNLANLVTMRNNSASQFRSEFFNGSVQEINTIFWPFIFQSENVLVTPDNEVSSKITVTAEAAFIATHIQRVIYEYVDLGGGNFNLIYIDPDDYRLQANDLRYTMNDLSSERSYTDKGISLDSLGHGNMPTKFENPVYINPNQSFEFRFSAEGTKSYICSIALIGYRARIQDASLLNIPTVTL